VNEVLLSVSIESGVLGIGDPSLQVKGGLHPDYWVEHIRQGKAAGVGTGGDGMFGVIVRKTEDSLDLLPEEGEKISGLREPLTISVPSGKLNVSDMAILDEPDAAGKNLYLIEPGIYSCMIHMCDNPSKEFFGFVIVLKKSGSPAAINENVREIETLG